MSFNIHSSALACLILQCVQLGLVSTNGPSQGVWRWPRMHIFHSKHIPSNFNYWHFVIPLQEFELIFRHTKTHIGRTEKRRSWNGSLYKNKHKNHEFCSNNILLPWKDELAKLHFWDCKVWKLVYIKFSKMLPKSIKPNVSINLGWGLLAIAIQCTYYALKKS